MIRCLWQDDPSAVVMTCAPWSVMSKGGLDAVKLGGGWRVLVTDVKGKELFRMFVSIHESCHI